MSSLPFTHQSPFTFLTLDCLQSPPSGFLFENFEIPNSHTELFLNLNGFNLRDNSKNHQKSDSWKKWSLDQTLAEPIKNIINASKNVTFNYNDCFIEESVIEMTRSFFESANIKNLTINLNNCIVTQQKSLSLELNKFGSQIRSQVEEFTFSFWANEKLKSSFSAQIFLSELLNSFLLTENKEDFDKHPSLKKLKLYLTGSNFDFLDFAMRLKRFEGQMRLKFESFSHLEVFMNKGLEQTQLLGLSEFMKLFDSDVLSGLKLFFEGGSESFLNENKAEYFRFLSDFQKLKCLAINFDCCIYKQKTAIDTITNLINFKNLEMFSFDQSSLDKNPFKNNIFASKMKLMSENLKDLTLNLSNSLLTSKKLNIYMRSLYSLQNIEKISLFIQDNKLTNLKPIFELIKKSRNLKSLILTCKNNAIESIAIRNFLKKVNESRCASLQEILLDFEGNLIIERRDNSEIRQEIQKIVVKNKKLINFKMSMDVEENLNAESDNQIEEEKWKKIEKCVNFRKVLATRLGLVDEKNLRTIFRRELIGEMIDGMNKL